jgi:type I restriction-modification system DNA methylase subunit
VLGTLERTKTISGRTITTRELGRHLQECGYTNRRLQKNYTYSDSSGEHTVPLVGFAHETFDARDACIAGLDANAGGVEQIQALVASYHGLGAPVVFACRQKELQWWSLITQGPESKEMVCADHKETVCADHVAKFFEEHRNQFSPESIYRAKNLGRLPSQRQLAFVDVGLMPLLEYEMGNRLAELIKDMLDAVHEDLGKPHIDGHLARMLFQSTFWLLAARILKDKGVADFSDLDLENVSGTLQKVHKHYSAEQPSPQLTVGQERSLRTAAGIVQRFGSLRHLTIESLAYVYENTLITKEIRKALGIHATPSYLVDYMVWQLAPWIEQIPQANRVVLEPTCGHAPFLVSAARLLREMINENDRKKRHEYLKKRLLGIEMDSFAREIALLSLTLADAPNPDGWRLVSTDVYQGETLSRAASNATILLCNPPWQDFTAEETAMYATKGELIQYVNKAAEVLARTLPYMADGSVFGVVLPRGFLNSKNATPLRKSLVEDFEIHEICLLPDNVFFSADHESSVFLGRKPVSKGVSNKIRYVRVREKTLKEFRDRYGAPTELTPQVRFRSSHGYDLRVPELEAVWSFCQSYPHLGEVLREAGKGLEYKRKEPNKKQARYGGTRPDSKGKYLPKNAQTVSQTRFPGAVRGYAKFDKRIRLTETPQLYWMNLDDAVIRRSGHGKRTGLPQVLLNSAPVSRGPWRLKALIDKEGHPVTSSFIVVRPKIMEWSLEVLWAILNSPLSNAFAYCHGTKRLVGVQTILTTPLPNINDTDLRHLSDLVKSYFELVSPIDKVLAPEADKAEAERRLLAIDAEVMRLYDLPPKLERQVLDLFAGWERLGVDFKFGRYFPRDLESCIPLHEYLSEEFQRSTVSFVSRWVEEVRSPQMIRALERAMETFKED